MIILDFINTNIDWISTLTLIATLITALTTLWAVKEMKKQRETSYHPEIYIGNETIYIYGEKYKDTYLPFDCTTESRKTSDNVFSKSLTVGLHNVGFAVAKAIDYEWSFDLKKIIEQINEVNKANFFHVYYDEKKIEISIPKVEYQCFHMIKNGLRKKSINYILPSSIEKNPTKIYIPFEYVDLYIIFLFSAFGFYDDNRDYAAKVHNVDTENFPPLRLKLSYKDLHGKTHDKNFILKFSFGTLTSPESITDDYKDFGYQFLVSSEQ